MRKPLPILAALVLAMTSCARAPARVEAPPAPPEECTLATPLLPGVPGSPGHLLPSEVNPNGASELATLMRAMQRDLEQARPVVERGGPPPPLFERHRRIRCSWPTEPTDRDAKFDALAQNYLAHVRALDERPSRQGFDAVVRACRTCHENTCPGPLVAIDKLRVDAQP